MILLVSVMCSNVDPLQVGGAGNAVLYSLIPHQGILRDYY